MSSRFFGKQQKTLHNRSHSSFDSLPRHAASPPRRPQYMEADKAVPSVSKSPTFASSPPSPKCPAPCTHTMSHTNSTVPSSKLPFSNSVTGNGAVLIGALASFDSEAPRGRPLSVAEDGATSGSSSGLSRAAVLMSARGDASPPFSPQPSGSVLAVFCPLTSKAWQSGTIRDGIAVDADMTSKVSTISPHTGLQSPLFFSSGWSQQSVSAAAEGTPPSFMGTPGQSLISAGAEDNDEDTAHNRGIMHSPNHSVSLLSAPKAFMAVYSGQSPKPLAMKFNGSPVFEVSLTTPPSIRAPRTGAARGAGATPAPSSCLPSESLEQYSLLRSPILHPLTPLSMSPSAPLSPGFGSIAKTEQTQSRLSRHRLAASAGSEKLPVKGSNEMRSRGAAVASPPHAAVPSVNSNRETLDDHLVSPPRRNYCRPLPSLNEASLSSFFAVHDAGLHANLPSVQASEEDAADRATSATLPRICSSEETDTEEGVAAAFAHDTTDDPFEAFWDISPASRWGSSATEILPHITTSSAPFETGSAFCSVTAFASETHEKDNHPSEVLNQNNRLSSLSMANQRNTIVHRPSAAHQRNSVNRSADTQRTASKATTLQQRQRRFSLQQEDTIEIKRRSYV